MIYIIENKSLCVVNTRDDSFQFGERHSDQKANETFWIVLLLAGQKTKQKKKQIANIHIKANVSLACDFNLFL